jgi:hypothetical protein
VLTSTLAWVSNWMFMVVYGVWADLAGLQASNSVPVAPPSRLFASGSVCMADCLIMQAQWPHLLILLRCAPHTCCAVTHLPRCTEPLLCCHVAAARRVLPRVTVCVMLAPSGPLCRMGTGWGLASPTQRTWDCE